MLLLKQKWGVSINLSWLSRPGGKDGVVRKFWGLDHVIESGFTMAASESELVHTQMCGLSLSLSSTEICGGLFWWPKAASSNDPISMKSLLSQTVSQRSPSLVSTWCACYVQTFWKALSDWTVNSVAMVCVLADDSGPLYNMKNFSLFEENFTLHTHTGTHSMRKCVY